MAEQSVLTVAADAQLARRLAQGQALICAKAATDFHAEPITLDRKSTSAQALFVVASSCLRQIALNQPGVLAGSPEALHQMRVGLRRLRAALSIFKRTLKPGELDDLKRELVWLTEQLAGAREFDAMLESHRKFDRATRATLAGEAELRRELTQRRHEAFAAAGRAVASARFERLIVSSAVVFLSCTDEDGLGGLPVRALARRALKRRRQHVLEGLEGFEQLDARERHQLRIRVKKLRYGTEFFSSLFARSRRAQARFVRALEGLQDTLGRLNDIAVLRGTAATWLDGATSAPASARIAFAMGVFTESEQAGEQSCIAEVAKLRAQLAKAPRFWR